MRKIYFQGFFLLLFGLFASMVGINKTIPEDKKVEVSQIEILNKRLPLYIGRSNVDPFSVKFNVTNNSGPLILNSVEISFTPLSKTSGITEIVISHEGTTMPTAVNSTFGSTTTITDLIKIKGTMELESGIHFLNVNFNLKNNPDLLTSVQVKTVKLSFKNHTDILINPKERFIYQPAMILRS